MMSGLTALLASLLALWPLMPAMPAMPATPATSGEVLAQANTAGQTATGVAAQADTAGQTATGAAAQQAQQAPTQPGGTAELPAKPVDAPVAATGAAVAENAAATGAAPADQYSQYSMEGGTYWLPQQAAVNTDNVDPLFYGVLGLSIFCFIGITLATVYFVIKYRARPGHKAQPSSHHNDTLEITWTIIPAIICVFLFLFGWRGYIDLSTPPQHALEIQVTAQKWSWNFTHPNGVNDAVLHVPVDRSVRVIMKSQDVLHSFFVPAFRVKQDVLPRRYTQIWFKAHTPGVYRLYCTEYCGQDHSMMKTTVVVHEPGGYEKYLANKEAEMNDLPPLELGKRVYDIRCVACHTTDGSPRVGPTFKGLFGTQRTMQDGATITADENYIQESILQPQVKIRQGFPPSMPSFDGQLSEKEITGVIEYIKSLK